jgi:hypothetical protein
MYDWVVEKKRLVIDLEEAAHTMLMNEARKRGLTLSNHVRGALSLPLERQGVRPDATAFAPPTIEDVPEFYLVQGRASYQVWIPGIGGQLQQVAPAPRLVKAGYASPDWVRSGQMQYAESTLRGEYPILLLPVPHSFGAPLRAVRVFSRDTPGIQPPSDAIAYLATTSRAPYSWIEDLRQGKRGYFLTGLPNATELWEIVSSEPDPADRCIFVLSPVKLPHGLPTPDFSKIGNSALRAEAQLHWSNLEQALIAHNPYGIVNSAASLSESLLHAFLTSPGNTRDGLGEMLERLRKELEKNSSAFTLLGYHFMQAVRIMHQSTQHPGRVLANGRPVRPRLALMIVEGMVEVLASLGIVR